MCRLVVSATMNGVRLTVLIVDDHEDFRRSARALLEAESFEVVGDVSGGYAAIAEVERRRPDIVLLDIQLPDLDGFVVAERLAALSEPPAVVLISSRDAKAYGPRIADSPVRGFIPKSALSGEAITNLIG
jgi:DNA-binding NarL/FixJ family response regulator